MNLEALLDDLWRPGQPYPRTTVAAVLTLALEIAREGHEGQPVGTLFTVGRVDEVLLHARPLILDPLAGHAPQSTHLADERLRGTIKQLAQLDGAFVVSQEGHVIAACRYLDVPSHGVELPFGLGSRHVAAASLSKKLGILTVVVSASRVVRVFRDGTLTATALPED